MGIAVSEETYEAHLRFLKKRNDLLNVDIPINSDATLIGSIVFAETGTLYAVKLSLAGLAENGALADWQRVCIWLRVVPGNTALPDLTANLDMDTINGFPAKCLAIRGNLDGPSTTLDIKFRYRRKVDDGEVLQVIGQHTNVQGTGRVVNIIGLMTAIVRMR